MKGTNIRRYIVADPEICHGKPTFKGTRVMVWQILEMLEAGETADEIYTAYPTLPKGAIKAALHFAAERIKSTTYVQFTQAKTISSQISL